MPRQLRLEYAGAIYPSGEKDLLGAPKGDKRKVRMAARLRGETTMTLKWIAERLVVGGWTDVSNLLGAERAKSMPNVKSEDPHLHANFSGHHSVGHEIS